MPIYEYFCEQCRESFSLLQRMGSGPGETTCPGCGSHQVKRQISACAIGSGAGGSNHSGG
jgi:putative FmdB family regulatory protein